MLIAIWNARLGLSPFTRYTLYYAMSNFGDVFESRQMKDQGLGHVDVTLPQHLVEESFHNVVSFCLLCVHLLVVRT
jgi:hypothetical protein